ncbi:hypothetical protein PN498_25310 [Oscillatoria sp. CS-180]|uniref:hypothetical protein n=1 Tax=Oscillatoria sp. CS-180 TaxID=3021720 RepID=UPI00232B2449|nr:hypothetical protein [Oscillatoria sp. CS-180]MDB9529336.1 hypothetical protein [Oscillatoria sp. CS-180]
MPVYFYLPEPFWRHDLPKAIGGNWTGFMIGIYAWTLQSYLWLKDRYPCELVNQLPEQGIVLVHSKAFRVHTQPVRPHPKRLLICMQADALPYPYAQLNIVQNRHQPGYFLPHWPQPGMIPRDPHRGDRFETIAFFGHQKHLTFLGSDWTQQLHDLGLNWQPRVSHNPWNKSDGVHSRWHDYSDVDAIVAVRSFDWRHSWRSHTYRRKPATKLYNSWLAGIPSVLGIESAYRAERQSPLDYLEVATQTDLLKALQQLKENRSLRQAMVHQGHARAIAVHPERVCEKWLSFLKTVAEPAYEQWVDQSAWQRFMTIKKTCFSTALNHLECQLRRQAPLP